MGNFFKQSNLVKIRQVDPPAKARHSLAIRGIRVSGRRGRAAGILPDFVRFHDEKRPDRETNPLEEAVMSQYGLAFMVIAPTAPGEHASATPKEQGARPFEGLPKDESTMTAKQLTEKGRAFLANTLVLDLTEGQEAFCSKLLADLGALVVKVEMPPGDPSRRIAKGGPGGRTMNPDFLYHNTNKLGVTLDPAGREGRIALRGLVEEADVLVEALSPARAQRFRHASGANPADQPRFDPPFHHGVREDRAKGRIPMVRRGPSRHSAVRRISSAPLRVRPVRSGEGSPSTRRPFSAPSRSFWPLKAGGSGEKGAI